MSLEKSSQGFLSALYHLQQNLAEITGMSAVSLTPMAGSQGEFAGVAMIKAYHQSRGDCERNGNAYSRRSSWYYQSASAVMCGFKVIEIPTGENGDIDLNELKKKLGPKRQGLC